MVSNDWILEIFLGFLKDLPIKQGFEIPKKFQKIELRSYLSVTSKKQQLDFFKKKEAIRLG